MYLNTAKTIATRRGFLRQLAAAGAFYSTAGLYSEALATVAPSLTQGPYYPLADDIPLDKDNDLVQLNDNTTPATGPVHYLYGRILDASGNAVKNALVELWHADFANGEYIYSAGTGRNAKADARFQGFGQFLTGSTGAYKFRTVKAGLYNGRTRHYHLAVTFPGRTTRYCTQLGWNEVAYTSSGAAWSSQNSNDGIFRSLTAAQKSLLLLNYTAVPGTTTGEKQATFDFQVNLTPTEPTYPAVGGLLTQGALVSGPAGSTPRYRLTFPAYANYTYEIYGNPTLADLEWKAVPFSLTQTGAIDRHEYTATSEGTVSLYVAEKAVKDFYKVSFRIPGANRGTP